MSLFCSSNIQISYSQIDIVTYVTSCYRLTPRLPKEIRLEKALTQLDVKILFDDFTYHAKICNTL